MAAQAFDLPEAVITVLPNDPFEQLDIARKITSIALATRVSALESEISYLEEIVAQKDDMIAELKAQVESFAQKDDIIAGLRTQVENLQASATGLSNSVAQANEEKERLVDENASLSNMVKKLNRDVTKLEVFKKALMQSLSEEEDGSQARASKAIPRQLLDSNFSTTSNIGEEETSSLASDGVSGNTDIDGSKQGYNIHIPSLSTTPRLSSRSTTPKLTPPGSPPRRTTSPPKLPGSNSDPRRHSIAVANRRSLFEADRSSAFSSTPPMTSPFDSASNAGRTRVDGKEFFRQVRSRLSIEQFSSFLANVKELNSHKQTREETLRKAEEIFGPDKKDLYTIFEGLITRNVH